MSTENPAASAAPITVVPATPVVDAAPVSPVASDASSAAPQAPTQATPEASSDGTQTARDPATGRFTKRTEQLNQQIATLTAQKHSLVREIEMQTRRLETLSRPHLPPPDPNDFEAQQSHQMRSALRQERLAETQESVGALRHQAAEIRRATFDAKMQAAAETAPQLQQAMQTFATLPCSEIAAELIAESDQAPFIVHHLATNPAEAYRIAALPPYRQAAEIARLEARLSAAPIRRVSQAPAPVQTVSGGSGSNTDLGSLSMSDYYAHRMKQMAGS